MPISSSTDMYKARSTPFPAKLGEKLIFPSMEGKTRPTVSVTLMLQKKDNYQLQHKTEVKHSPLVSRISRNKMIL